MPPSAESRFGLGLPVALRPPVDFLPLTRTNYAARPFYQLGVSFFKIALLISYLSLVQGTTQRAYRSIVICIIVLVFLGHLGSTLCLIFACQPVHKAWDPDVPGSCLALRPSFTGYSMVTIISDIVVALIPIPVLLKLNISRGKKYGLIGIFLLGLFTTICSVLRYLEIGRVQYGDGNPTMLILWGAIEFNVGNVVTSLPFLAPVFIRKAREYSGSKRTADRYASTGHRSGKGSHTANIILRHLSTTSRAGAGPGARGSTGKKSPFNASQENILWQEREDPAFQRSIMKSVSYSVRVEDEEAGGSVRKPERAAGMPGAF